jgi:hypothetical protein
MQASDPKALVAIETRLEVAEVEAFKALARRNERSLAAEVRLALRRHLLEAAA